MNNSQGGEVERRIAELIADRLFMNGAGEKAQRLVLTVDTPQHRNLGGWCRGAVVDQIVEALVSSAPPTEDQDQMPLTRGGTQAEGSVSSPPHRASGDSSALQWTLDNVYTIARRWLRKMERLSYTDEERDGWRHVIRLCEKVGCEPRGVLRDSGGSV